MRDFLNHTREALAFTYHHFKGYLDLISLSTLLATLTAWLPPLAALVSLIWGVIRIYETPTVQSWFRKKRQCKACAAAARKSTLKDSA